MAYRGSKYAALCIKRTKTERTEREFISHLLTRPVGRPSLTNSRFDPPNSGSFRDRRHRSERKMHDQSADSRDPDVKRHIPSERMRESAKRSPPGAKRLGQR